MPLNELFSGGVLQGRAGRSAIQAELLTCLAYNIKIIKHFSMCFFKKIEFGVPSYLLPDTSSHSALSQAVALQGDAYCPCQPPFQMGLAMPHNWFFPALPYPQQLNTLISSIGRNNQMLQLFAEKIDQNSRLLETAQSQFTQALPTPPTDLPPSPLTIPTPTAALPPCIHPLIPKLFGQKGYKYKLKLSCDFPRLIYKQRNLNVGVKLVDFQGRNVSNGNLIHICMGACDQEGRWLVGQEGELFMQGRVEVDLYHGEADFRKIYPRDVSRHFLGGYVNIVIYAKPSIISFAGSGSKRDQVVDFSEIEPLLLVERVVKAKKKGR